MNRDLFAGLQCDTCPAGAGCSVANTDEACGPAAKYRAPSAMPDSVEWTSSSQFGWPPAPIWTAPPTLPSSIVSSEGHGQELVTTGVRLTASLMRVLDQRGPVLADRIVVLHGHDNLLNQVWANSYRLGPALADAGVAAVIAPAFSQYDDASPFDNHVNILRTAHLATTLNRDVPTVPAIAWRHNRHLDMWLEWFNQQRPHAISIDSGRATNRKGGPDWLTESLEYLARRLIGPTPRLVISGPGTAEMMMRVAASWPASITFVSQTPAMKALNHFALDDDLTAYPSDESFGCLLDLNTDKFARFAIACNVAASRPVRDLA